MKEKITIIVLLAAFLIVGIVGAVLKMHHVACANSMLCISIVLKILFFVFLLRFIFKTKK
jgi:hypothetical protein